MAIFTLRRREGTETFQRITTGRKWVGRVFPRGSGGYGAKLYDAFHEGPFPTALAAFEHAVAAHGGFKSVQQLNAHNFAVSARKRAIAEAGRALGDQMLSEVKHGKFTTLDKIPDQHQPVAFGLLINAFTRDLKR
jgi:hypothetical protein